jgi:putative DNA primase/helicase
MSISRRNDNNIVSLRPGSSEILRGAQSFANEHQDIVYVKDVGSFYQYVHGKYLRLEPCEIMRILIDSEAVPEIQSWSPTKRNQLLNDLKSMRYYALQDFNQQNLMNFKNCYVDLETLQTYEHSQEFLSTFQLPYDYDKDAKCEVWLKTIDRIMGGDQYKINLIQEFFGYCFTYDQRYKKALFMVGVADSGKSTILHAIEQVLGSENYTSLPLENFSRTPHETACLVDKLANIVGELPSNAGKYTEIFKNITGGDSIIINEKRGNIFHYKPYCKMIFSGNDMPFIEDSSDAIYRRLLFIELLEAIPLSEQDPNLWPKIDSETSGIFNWALEGLKRLNSQGHFTLSDLLKERIKTLKEENNPLLLFFNEGYVISPDDNDYLLVDSLFEDFHRFARSNNLRSNFTKQNFGRELKKLLGPQIDRGFKRINGQTKRVWMGIRKKGINESLSSNDRIDWED